MILEYTWARKLRAPNTLSRFLFKAKLLFASCVVLLIDTFQTSAAEFYIRNLESGGSIIEIIGALESNDGIIFTKLINELNSKGIVVYSVELRSPGGSVLAGMKIGREIRKARISTSAPSKENNTFVCHGNPPTWSNRKFYPDMPNCICASACALAWFGGVIRFGAVGIHRSFLPDSGGRVGYDDMERALSAADSEIRLYLEDMRIPQPVIEMALSVSSVNLWILDSFENESIGTDRIYREYLISECGSGPTREDIDTRSELFYKKHIQKKQLTENEETILRLLTAAGDPYSECVVSANWRAKKSAQLR